ANLIGCFAAGRAKTSSEVRATGIRDGGLTVYASVEAHTWIQKAADLSGLGTDAIRWIEADEAQRLDVDALRGRITEDRTAGRRPFLVVGSAGTVSTGAIDPLPELAAV